MKEENFYRFYQYIKANHRNSKEALMMHISVLRMYLLAIGKEDIYINKYPLKLHVRTFFEVILGMTHLIQHIFCGICRKKSNALILILEPTHLKQMLGMAPYLSSYRPIFLTTKRNYISLLKNTFTSSRVIYIPTFFINPQWTKQATLARLYKEHHIDVSPEVLAYTSTIVNDQVNHYRYIKFLLHVLLKFHPIKIALVFNDLTITGRIISLVLQENNCKTCYVMHGLLSDEFIESLHVADEFLIFGEYTRPILVKRGIDSSRIHNIGTPYLNYYRTTPPNEELSKVVLNPHTQHKSVVLILLSGRGHTTSSKHHDMLINLLNEIIETNKEDYYFIFKLHKKDYIYFYHPLLNNKKIENCFAIYPFDYFNSKESIFDWLTVSDTIITGASTTALEAMYLKKPVITIDLMGEYENETLYINQNGTYHCRNKNDLQRHLDFLKLNQFPAKEGVQKITSDYFSDEVTMHRFFLNTFGSLIS